MTLVPRSIARTMTGITWADFSANAWTICSEVAAATGARSGCEICYARSFAINRLGLPGWGDEQPRHAFRGFAARLRRLDRLARETGLPFSVFVMSLGDWLDPAVPAGWRAALIDAIEASTGLTILTLTHRPKLAPRYLPAAWRTALPAHIWPGVTLDHAAHGRRWQHHRAFFDASGRAWVSAEPLLSSLEGVDLTAARCIVLGGASGAPDASWALDPRWVDEAVVRYGTQVYFKQWGDFDATGRRVGKRAAGAGVDGRVYAHTPWPRHRALLAARAQRPE